MSKPRRISSMPALHIDTPSSIAVFTPAAPPSMKLLPGTSPDRPPSGQQGNRTRGYVPQSRREKDRRALLIRELFGGVFQSDELLSKIFSLKHNAVIPEWKDKLRSIMTSFSPVSDLSFDPNPTRDIMAKLSRCRTEKESVELLVQLLRHVANSSPSPSAAATHAPDFRLFESEQRFCADLENFIVVKGDWPAMLLQTASHGRSLLCYRWYAFGIAYNHKDMTLMFIFFTRQGMFVTSKFSLINENDLPIICSTLFSLRLCSPYQLGRHPLIYASGAEIRSILLPGMFSTMEWRHVEKVLCRRDSVRGRGTTVFTIAPASAVLAEKANINPANSLSPGKRKAAEDVGDTPDAKRAKPDSWKPCSLSAHEWWNMFTMHPDSDLTKALQDAIKDLKVPSDRLVVKTGSVLSADADVQVNMWKTARGMHGVLDVCGVIKLKHGLDIFRDLGDVQKTPHWKQVYHPDDPPMRVEDRTEVITIMKDNGAALSGLKDMRILIKAIIDAIVGHCNCFEKGFLQRDVSPGNILLLHTTQDRSDKISNNTEFILSLDFLRSHLDKCTAVLIDSDSAMEWRQPRPEMVSDRSGTSPFVSYRLCEFWSADISILHTALDDLESFAWVVLWEALRTEYTVKGSEWLGHLSNADLSIVSNMKAAIRGFYTDPFGIVLDQMNLPSSVITLRPLLTRLFALCSTHSSLINQFIMKISDVKPGNQGRFTPEQLQSMLLMSLDMNHRDKFVRGMEELCREGYRSFLSILVDEYNNLTLL